MDIKNYENFCQNSGYGSFMQSTLWGKVKSEWIDEYIIVKDDDDNIIGEMLILIKKIPFLNTSFMYAPRGPVCDMHNRTTLNKIMAGIVMLQKKYHSFLLKIDPIIDENDSIAINNLRSLGFVHRNDRVGYENIQCRENYVIEFNNRSADEIFDSFKSKWRYNIRLATKKGVKCDFYGAEKIDDFYVLMEQTAKRDNFDIRSKEYFLNILKQFKQNAQLCICYLNNIPLSGALIFNYAKTVSYVYGCSSNEYRNYMPNYLMQWTMIKYAVDNGCNTYDFCGIPYWYDENHRNYGVYKFKQGFGGNVKTFAGEFDLMFNKVIGGCFDFAVQHKKSKK